VFGSSGREPSRSHLGMSTSGPAPPNTAGVERRFGHRDATESQVVAWVGETNARDDRELRSQESAPRRTLRRWVVLCSDVTDSENAFATARMMPAITKSNRFFWTSGQDGHLRILRCGTCGQWIHPPTGSCSSCGGSELSPQPVSGRGQVFTFTINRHPYNPAVPPPYVIAIVVLDEADNLRLLTNLVNCEPEDVSVGMPVRVLFEQHDKLFIPLFEPDPT
jgi:uncharacterized protein